MQAATHATGGSPSSSSAPSPSSYTGATDSLLVGGGAYQQQHAVQQPGMQPMQSLMLLEDMLISPRFDTHSPHYRPFPAAQQELLAVDSLDVASKKDQNRSKPRFSTSSLPDVDW